MGNEWMPYGCRQYTGKTLEVKAKMLSSQSLNLCLHVIYMFYYLFPFFQLQACLNCLEGNKRSLFEEVVGRLKKQPWSHFWVKGPQEIDNTLMEV